MTADDCFLFCWLLMLITAHKDFCREALQYSKRLHNDKDNTSNSTHQQQQQESIIKIARTTARTAAKRTAATSTIPPTIPSASVVIAILA